MNSVPYFNNRMDGVEIAESLLYKDFEKPYSGNSLAEKYLHLSSHLHNKSILTELFHGSRFITGDVFPRESDKMGNPCVPTESIDCKQAAFCVKPLDRQCADKLILHNNSAFALSNSTEKSNLSEENMVFDNLVRSSSHFRPISPDIFNKPNENHFNKSSSKSYQSNSWCNSFKKSTKADGDVNSNTTELGHWLCSSSPPSEEFENKAMVNDKKTGNENRNSLFKIYSQTKYENSNEIAQSREINDNTNQPPPCYSQTPLNKTYTEDSLSLRTDTLCDSRCFTYNNKNVPILQRSTNWKPLSENSISEQKIDIFDRADPERNMISSVPITFSNHNGPDSSISVTCTTASFTAPTITIPRGSYIFIPLSVQNYQLRETNKPNTSNIDLSSVSVLNSSKNGLNKLIIGCYPVLNQLPDMKLANKQLQTSMVSKQTCNDNAVPTSTEIDSCKSLNIRLQATTSLQTNTTNKINTKKYESAEFNQYLENLNESHRLLIKEKNKIAMDRTFFKDDKPKNIINLNTTYEKTLTKLEKELNAIINSLLEINVLISKIESIRGISFIEPFYNMIQKSAELIQNFQWKSTDDPCQRNSNTNKMTENEALVQIANLKQLYNDLQKFRNFLWASYTNLNFDQQRQLSISLGKLKSWTETKANMKINFKSKDNTLKYPLPNCSVEPFISSQNFISNSSKQTMKLENNSVTLPRQQFSIPVSRYTQMPNRMTTILHGYPNQTSISNTQFSYFRTPLSSFPHPTLINTNKFSIGSNCRISYGPQQQIYTATPILANTQSSVSPRNFLIAQSSLVTPILYQNNGRQVLNNGSLNYMVYNPNPQII